MKKVLFITGLVLTFSIGIAQKKDNKKLGYIPTKPVPTDTMSVPFSVADTVWRQALKDIAAFEEDLTHVETRIYLQMNNPFITMDSFRKWLIERIAREQAAKKKK